MNTAPSFKLSPLPSPGLGDVLDQLTITYRDMVAQHGPLMGFAAQPPAGARQFEAEQARKGLEIDAARNPAEKAAALLDREADRHQQIGRLSYYIAGYELSHGNKDNAAPLQQLGDDHFDLAEGIRAQRDAELAALPGGLLVDFVTADTKAAANANERQMIHGRDL